VVVRRSCTGAGDPLGRTWWSGAARRDGAALARHGAQRSYPV